MNIEIVEFYPIKKDNKRIQGTLHLYIEDWKMDLRGVWLCKFKNKSLKEMYMFRMPWKQTFDENGKEVRYPVIAFVDQTIEKQIFDFLHDSGKRYVEQKLEEGVKFPPVKKNKLKHKQKFNKKKRFQPKAQAK